ncbi:zincin-like metallopeptidase domain-containing protein [uncultured Desulfovibrio sp.]|uniref:zincin-like metallopeptidase domain-containing protein n=1 Tax=uncultured Desulfovibrio sp. TaxID=167968 RepID=UPI0026055400|nr:zincin-like metallopeptidase domain-containing protein [uncultured Desulfovibrio sp.]
MAENKKERTPFHVEFANKVIKALEEGTAPWQKPWRPAENLAPRNPLSGTVYKGMNRLHLAMAGYEDPRWMTLKQANEAGYRIKEGSRSTAVVYYQFTREQDKLDENSQPVLGEDGKPVRETVALERPVMRMAHVFNARQVENFPPLPEHEKAFAWNPQERAEAVLANSGAVIKHDQHDRAFYRVRKDEIHLPPRDSFDQGDKYYATALHELGHWTGHPDRMNRAFGPFGSSTYAKEELRAEISSWMVGQDIGVGHDPGQHAAYVKSWIAALKDDPLEIMRACRDAEHIRDYVLELEMRKEKTMEREQQQTNAAKEADHVDSWGKESVSDPALAKTYLHVPYKDKEAAKALGARWDGKQKRWYAPEGTDLAPLRRFMTPLEQNVAEARHDAPAENLSPQEEFARKLADLGLDLKGQLPELDGKTHRVPLLSKNGRGLDGIYCLYGDGVPAGWAQNHVTGEKVKLVATGVVLSQAERERQQRERAARLQAANEERARQHDAAARRCQGMWDSFAPAASSPYLEKKGVEAFGLKEDQGNLIVPLRNIAGELRGFQAIAPDGQKVFATGMEKKGHFHLIGAEGKDLPQGEIVLCEGYATGASLHMATGRPVAVAFDSGNLISVAEAIRNKYPKAAITICADNDHAMKRDGQPYNVGVEKAKLAARKVNGKVKVPTFTDREKAQGLTDFNDLHKARGLEAVRRQTGMERGKDQGREVSQ